MSNRIPSPTPDSLTGDQARLYAAITSGPRSQGPQHFPLTAPDGSLRGPFNAFLLSPSLGEALQSVGSAIRFGSSLPERTREIAVLLVAARWDSAFERDSHEAIARAAGLDDETILGLRTEDVSALDGAELLAGTTVIALLDGDLDDAQWSDSVDTLGESAVFELTCLVGYYATLALQLRVFRV